ncbi:hypothetical protein ACFW16_11605 [Inquilinus sp. NPDC058860]|uniref:hypothetical protein n=1 Tax=Inquilinus sp. NPDC058860 TaxID=3346652 RepID=UPI0036A81485
MFYIRSKSFTTTWTVMGHIQQLAFALGPIEARPAAPARPRAAGRSARAAAPPAQPLLPDAPGLAPATATAPAVVAPAAPARASPPLPVADGPDSGSMPGALAPPTVERPLSDDAAPSPVKAALYLVIGFARGRERRRGGWQRLTEQGFASRRLAEEHAARLLARGRADGAVLARQDLAADMDAADEPVLLARLGDLPTELLEG